MSERGDDADNLAHLDSCPGCDECSVLLEFYAACMCGHFGHKSVMEFDADINEYRCVGLECPPPEGAPPA